MTPEMTDAEVRRLLDLYDRLAAHRAVLGLPPLPPPDVFLRERWAVVAAQPPPAEEEPPGT